MAAVLCAGCAASVHAPQAAARTASLAELAQLYEADQAERANPDFFKNAYSSRDSMFALLARDSVRLARARSLVAGGGAHTAADFFHAAIIAQHGADTTAYRQAAEWAARAVALDSTYPDAKWLTAAARDRYLKAIGRPQCYGTQIVQDSATAPWRLYEVDATCTTDADRQRLGVSSLATMHARVDSMNAASRPKPH